MSVYKTYTPLKVEGGHRVYARVEDRLYKIYLQDDLKREFTDETLPDEIKVIIGLINAYDWKDIHKHPPYMALAVPESIVWHFAKTYPENLIDIGWRQGDDYCLVLPDNVFNKLRGGMTVSE